jgi:hypothetical protein
MVPEDIGTSAPRQEQKSRRRRLTRAVLPAADVSSYRLWPTEENVACGGGERMMCGMGKSHDRGKATTLMTRQRRILIVILIVLAVLWAAGKVGILYVDYLWFDSLGFGSVFTTGLWAKVALAVGAFVCTAVWLAGNVYLAVRLAPGGNFLQIRGLPWVVTGPQLMRLARIGGALAILVASLMVAGGAAGLWYETLQFLNRPAFGWTDPVLGRDAGFYVFSIPILSAIKTYVMVLAVLGCLGAGAAYFLCGALGGLTEHATRAATTHLAAMLAVLLAAVAYGYWLDRFDLMLSSRGAVFGVGYADAHGMLPALDVMMIASLAAAVLVLAAGIQRRPKVALVVLVLLVLVHGAAVWSYPPLVQRFDVVPNELVRETPYLKNNIEATRFAFGLDKAEVRPYSGTAQLTLGEVERATGTIDNVRIWDWRVLLQVYNQIQSLRPYYRFNDVDVDRYTVGGRYRQVTLTVRELETRLLNADSRTWPNLHLLYTHGYGAVMSPVNVVTAEGLPDLWIGNIPPQSRAGIEVNRPEIYFGELTNDYIFIKTTQREFDYPLGDKNVDTVYAGKAGVPVNSLARAMLMAYYFGDLNILLTSSFTSETRALWARQVRLRVTRLAPPVLSFDDDPYAVVVDGRVVWVIDAYATTRRFPYSSRVRGGTDGPNYIRNSVKATVDAYDGTVTFYVADPQDPLVQAARRVFPSLFRDMAEMPESLRVHLRYPNDLFEIQAEQYLAYHMTDPRIFYNKEDLWQRPTHMYDGQRQALAAYYFIMTLPTEEQEEYILMLPFTPAGKDNMVGWMAGRCDGQEYGKLLVYTFPKDRLLFGPNQVEARINQNDEISPQLTLWNQHGSRVVRGNLLVIPVGDSILYVEPLYLKSEGTAIPELKRVIVSYQDRIAMRNTLAEALEAVFRQGPPAAKPPEQVAVPAAPAPAAGRALELFQKAQRKLRDGDWAGYGAAVDELGKVLREMAAPPPQKP